MATLRTGWRRLRNAFGSPDVSESPDVPSGGAPAPAPAPVLEIEPEPEAVPAPAAARSAGYRLAVLDGLDVLVYCPVDEDASAVAAGLSTLSLSSASSLTDTDEAARALVTELIVQCADEQPPLCTALGEALAQRVLADAVRTRAWTSLQSSPGNPGAALLRENAQVRAARAVPDVAGVSAVLPMTSFCERKPYIEGPPITTSPYVFRTVASDRKSGKVTDEALVACAASVLWTLPEFRWSDDAGERLKFRALMGALAAAENAVRKQVASSHRGARAWCEAWAAAIRVPWAARTDVAWSYTCCLQFAMLDSSSNAKMSQELQDMLRIRNAWLAENHQAAAAPAGSSSSRTDGAFFRSSLDDRATAGGTSRLAKTVAAVHERRVPRGWSGALPPQVSSCNAPHAADAALLMISGWHDLMDKLVAASGAQWLYTKRAMESLADDAGREDQRVPTTEAEDAGDGRRPAYWGDETRESLRNVVSDVLSGEAGPPCTMFAGDDGAFSAEDDLGFGAAAARGGGGGGGGGVLRNPVFRRRSRPSRGLNVLLEDRASVCEKGSLSVFEGELIGASNMTDAPPEEPPSKRVALEKDRGARKQTQQQYSQQWTASGPAVVVAPENEGFQQVFLGDCHVSPENRVPDILYATERDARAIVAATGPRRRQLRVPRDLEARFNAREFMETQLRWSSKPRREVRERLLRLALETAVQTQLSPQHQLPPDQACRWPELLLGIFDQWDPSKANSDAWVGQVLYCLALFPAFNGGDAFSPSRLAHPYADAMLQLAPAELAVSRLAYKVQRKRDPAERGVVRVRPVFVKLPPGRSTTESVSRYEQVTTWTSATSEPRIAQLRSFRQSTFEYIAPCITAARALTRTETERLQMTPEGDIVLDDTFPVLLVSARNEEQIRTSVQAIQAHMRAAAAAQSQSL